ncbi:MAG: hypothetical protein K2W96_01710 [Gemmataceae bacterium]|nr:hypothetical protein [Gemmataceae bacterium]
MKQFTYKRMDELFRSFGFTVQELDGNTIVFHHPGSGALFTLPLREETALVSPMHMGGAMATLDAWGYLPQDEFRALARKAG